MTVERLQNIVAIVRRADPTLAAWLAAGLAGFDRGESLGDALGLSRAAALERRNAALRYAAGLIAKPTCYQAAKRLMQWLDWIQADGRPRDRIERFLVEIAATGLELEVRDGELWTNEDEIDNDFTSGFIDRHEAEIIEALTREDSEIETAVQRAIAAGAPMPKTVRHMSRIISDMDG